MSPHEPDDAEPMHCSLPPLAVTVTDPNGVGPPSALMTLNWTWIVSPGSEGSGSCEVIVVVEVCRSTVIVAVAVSVSPLPSASTAPWTEKLPVSELSSAGVKRSPALPSARVMTSPS